MLSCVFRYNYGVCDPGEVYSHMLNFHFYVFLQFTPRHMLEVDEDTIVRYRFKSVDLFLIWVFVKQELQGTTKNEALTRWWVSTTFVYRHAFV